jgi:hypothetical protein
LRLLMSRPSHVFSRARLLDHWHNDLRDVNDSVIDSHIKNLRRKLEAAGAVGHNGRRAKARQTLGTKPDFSCTSRILARMSSGNVLKSGRG